MPGKSSIFATVYGETEISPLPRTTLALGHALALAAAAWILLGAPVGVRLVGLTTVDTASARRILVLAAAAVYFVRVLGSAFILLHRRMRYDEALTIVVWVAVIHIWFALLARSVARPLGAGAMIGLVLYVAGSALNTGAEWARTRWKRRPGNAGHLYTRGPFRLTRHPNYLGDTVLFTGYALLTGRAVALVIPIIMVAMFTTLNIPMLDRYLAQRYGAEYARWAAGTKRFIPWVY